MIKEAQEKLNKYLKRSFPDLSRDYKIYLKANNGLNVNENDNVKNLINSIYYAQNSGKFFAGSSIVKLTKSLALYLDDIEAFNEIEIICAETKLIPSYSVLESIVQRYFSANYRLSTRINYRKRKYLLSQLYKFYQEKNSLIWLLFIDLIKRNDIHIEAMGLPNFEKLSEGLG